MRFKGTEGGFDVAEKYDIQEELAVVELPSWKRYALDDASLSPEVLFPFQCKLSWRYFRVCFWQLQVAVATILSTESASKQDELAALAGTWDGDKRVVSK